MKNNDPAETLDMKLQLPGVRPELFRSDKVGEWLTRSGEIETTFHPRNAAPFTVKTGVSILFANGHPWLLSFLN